jgi:hypothetical protein
VSALLDHKWGISSAQDRVWAQVTGLRLCDAERRLLMALNFQAFIDDSITPGGEFVLAGHIATAEKWALFAKDWEDLLPLGTIAKNNKYHFKMSEMAISPERMERVPAFYRVIEKHVDFSISCRINLADFARAHERAEIATRSLGWIVNFHHWKNPYFFTFRGLMDNFHLQKDFFERVIPLNEKVDFIFDNTTEKTSILAAWDDYLSNRFDEIRDDYGATPRFEDDQEFLPLQGADLWAWWVREWYEEEASPLPAKMDAFDFGTWRGIRRPFVTFGFTEQGIFDGLMQSAIISSSSGRDPFYSGNDAK